MTYWCYFDGTTQIRLSIRGVGGILYLIDFHGYNLSAGIGATTNNRAGLMALRMVLNPPLPPPKELPKD